MLKWTLFRNINNLTALSVTNIAQACAWHHSVMCLMLCMLLPQPPDIFWHQFHYWNCIRFILSFFCYIKYNFLTALSVATISWVCAQNYSDLCPKLFRCLPKIIQMCARNHSKIIQTLKWWCWGWLWNGNICARSKKSKQHTQQNQNQH